jgi:hypothetical protein
MPDPPPSFSIRASMPSRLSRKWPTVWLMLGMASLLEAELLDVRRDAARRSVDVGDQRVGAGGLGWEMLSEWHFTSWLCFRVPRPC